MKIGFAIADGEVNAMLLNPEDGAKAYKATLLEKRVEIVSILDTDDQSFDFRNYGDAFEVEGETFESLLRVGDNQPLADVFALFLEHAFAQGMQYGKSLKNRR